MRMVKLAWQKLKGPSSSRAIYLKHFTKFPNIGDRFSLLLAEKTFGHKIITCNELPLKTKNLILVGSIIHWADEHSIVSGAGFIAQHVKIKQKPSLIVSVRGPLTAEKLREQGIDCTTRYADPGVLAVRMFSGKTETKYPIGFIPHYWDLSNTFTEYCRHLGICILNVQDDPDVFFNQMRECEVLFSSSLHGLIFAHSFGKPALWLEVSNKVIGDGFKFYDYYSSLGIKPEKVVRQVIRPDQFPNPMVLRDEATFCSQSALISNIEESLHIVKQNLFG